MYRVTLSYSEILSGAMAGVMRQAENIQKRREHAHNLSDDEANPWQIHVEGALGEQALAKLTGIYWAGKGGLRDPDVGEHFEVRTTKYHTGKLLLHPEDADDRLFYLATGENGHYRIHGYIRGSDGIRQEWWGEPRKNRPCFCVPQDVLIPL